MGESFSAQAQPAVGLCACLYVYLYVAVERGHNHLSAQQQCVHIARCCREQVIPFACKAAVGLNAERYVQVATLLVIRALSAMSLYPYLLPVSNTGRYGNGNLFAIYLQHSFL